MQTRRGVLLMEALVGFFLIFLSAITMLDLLRYTDRGYSEAGQSSIALELAQQGLEKVRSGVLPKTVGSQSPGNVSQLIGRSPIVFTPTIVVTSVSPVLLVRSQVAWSENGRNHQIELKTYVAP